MGVYFQLFLSQKMVLALKKPCIREDPNLRIPTKAQHERVSLCKNDLIDC